MRDVRIGILGASRVAVYAVIEPASQIEGVTICAVAARDPERAARYAGRHAIPRVFSSYQELIASDQVDLVYVSTPPACHVEQALMAIEARKAVLVEKPFALSAEEAERVRHAAQAAGVKVYEAMHSPHHPLFARVLEIIRSGALGRVLSIEAEFSTRIEPDDPFRWSAALGGGALMDLGVYPLAWVRRIAGEDFRVATARATMQGDVDASYTAELSFSDGVTALLSSSMIGDASTASLSVRGERGEMAVTNPLAPQLGHSLSWMSDGVARAEQVAGPASFSAQLTAVAADLRGIRSFPFPDDDYVRSMLAIERVRAAF